MDSPRLCRREIQDEGQPVRYCNKPIKRANSLDWCEDDRARLPFWPAGDAPPKHHAAFDRKTGEGQEHLGPRGIETFVKADEFSEAS